MNRSFLGEVLQEGLAYLALDVFRFLLCCCGARCIMQDLSDFLFHRAAEIHEAKYHAPMFFDMTTLDLNHRAVHVNGFAGPGIFHLQGKHRPFGGRQLGVEVASLG